MDEGMRFHPDPRRPGWQEDLFTTGGGEQPMRRLSFGVAAQAAARLDTRAAVVLYYAAKHTRALNVIQGGVAVRAASLPLLYNAVDILERNLAERADKVALYSDSRNMTFRQVSDEAN